MFFFSLITGGHPSGNVTVFRVLRSKIGVIGQFFTQIANPILDYPAVKSHGGELCWQTV